MYKFILKTPIINTEHANEIKKKKNSCLQFVNVTWMDSTPRMFAVTVTKRRNPVTKEIKKGRVKYRTYSKQGERRNVRENH